MTIQQLILLMENDMNKCLQFCEAHAPVKNVYDNTDSVDPLKQYEPRLHDIMDTAKRMDKVINNESGQMESLVKVARLPMPVQKKIVLTSAAFLGKPTLEANADTDQEKNLLQVVKDTWTAGLQIQDHRQNNHE